MATATVILARAARVLNPAWLTGPIFEKELRVSSRRRRSYLIRVAYLALLALFVVPVWIEGAHSSRAYAMARMADFGRSITMVIVWVQFFALPFVAVILCSTCISEEIYHRTLGVLMTTPINAFQIVMGKLLSRMFQLLVLLAISLPLLAVVRVFGGVPWDFLVSSLCIILTTVVFCGAISIFFSIGNRHAYAAILKTFGVVLLLFGLFPALVGLLWARSSGGEQSIIQFLYYTNPGIAMGFASESLSGRGGGGPGFNVYWFGHCGVMLGVSAIVLAICVVRVRKAALSQVSGGEASGPSSIPAAPGRLPRNRPVVRRALPAPAATDLGWQDRPFDPDQPSPAISAEAVIAAIPVRSSRQPTIRPVTNHPVIWKELRPAPSKRRVRGIIGSVLAVLVLLLLYVAFASRDMLHESETQVMLVCLLLVCGLVSTAVNAATMITTEREANSWPILLTTTLTGWDILFGKAVGVLRRTAAVWIVLSLHILVFSMLGTRDTVVKSYSYSYDRYRYIPPAAVPWLVLDIAGAFFFLTCTGLFFSSRMKRTSSAVVMNLLLGAGLWVIAPAAMSMNGFSYHQWYMNPLVQAGGLIVLLPEQHDRIDLICWLVATTVTYGVLGMLIFVGTASSMRRRIF